MKLILGGGGSGIQTAKANKLFNDIIDNEKPILYVPFAWKGGKESYPKCLEWLTDELASIKKTGIDMFDSGEQLADNDLSKYTAIFIGGGNTYKLLKILKETKAFDNIKNYLAQGGIVYGGSAGSVIFGKSIDVIEYMDPNEVGLTDTAGFDMIGGMSLAPHYTSQSQEKTEIATRFLKEYSKKEPVVAAPEENALYVVDGEISVVGDGVCYSFDKGESKVFGTRNFPKQ
jgi:dipeptidase E